MQRSLSRYLGPARWLLAAACIVAAPASLAASAAPGLSLAALSGAWRDDGGQAFSLEQLGGRPVVVTMAYANCHRFCPMTMKQLSALQASADRAHRPVEFVVIGLDPIGDTPADWHHYRETRHLRRANWHFLTGTTDDVAATAHQLGFENTRMDEHLMHDTHVLLFNTRGTLASELDPDAHVLPATE